MSSQVKVLISMALVAVSSGAVAAGVEVTLIDAAGASQNVIIRTSEFPAPDAQGKFSLEADFSNVATGAFTGSVQVNDTNAQPLGASMPFNGTNTNLQPQPVSVTVAFA